ncbi:hypothetical protein [Paenibacillus sp. OAS669]|uniref:hypothetical protein n=1 Tax=Paenibacillus sp. OAS669 TaxID=2663821 RepID=UPI001789ABC8|nr:hypothetical protein [Paenibacillus sp. OAS669]MBE1447026.1 putative SAM-dependent methyltransferase [Paenibacillus sp. OAS669]
MYQNFQQNSFQPQVGSGNVVSQYRGLENRYQPVGTVQSQYQSGNQQFQGSNQFSSFQSPQNYHTANYRGNQQGHDAYLRSDSNQPAQQFGGSFLNQAPSFNSNFNSSFSGQQFVQQNPEAYHTANYRGNQQGHDAYLRSDSSQPAQQQFGIGQSFNAGLNFGGSQQYGQVQSSQAYHTANYRGNQQGHDAYLRSDSSQPAQQQFGISSFGFNRQF